MRVMLLAALLAGCAGAPLTPEEQAVRVLWKSDAPAECRRIKTFVTYGGIGGPVTDEGRERKVRRETRKAGGDTAVVNRMDEFHNIYATAFACK